MFVAGVVLVVGVELAKAPQDLAGLVEGERGGNGRENQADRRKSLLLERNSGIQGRGVESE